MATGSASCCPPITLRRPWRVPSAELDRSVIDEVVLVDDASTDRTVELAHRLGLEPIRHENNLGYGGNQKTCYRRVLELGADVIVMVHPDYQYSPRLVPAMASMIAYGEYDLVLGSRILAQNSVARGMPRYKYVANRALTLVENIVLRPEAVRVPHRPARVQQHAARRLAVRAQLR